MSAAAILLLAAGCAQVNNGSKQTAIEGATTVTYENTQLKPAVRFSMDVLSGYQYKESQTGGINGIDAALYVYDPASTDKKQGITVNVYIPNGPMAKRFAKVEDYMKFNFPKATVEQTAVNGRLGAATTVKDGSETVRVYAFIHGDRVYEIDVIPADNADFNTMAQTFKLVTPSNNSDKDKQDEDKPEASDEQKPVVYTNEKFGYTITVPTGFVAFSGLSSTADAVIPPDANSATVTISENNPRLFCCEVPALRIGGFQTDLTAIGFLTLNQNLYSDPSEIKSIKEITFNGVKAAELRGGGNMGSSYRVVVVKVDEEHVVVLNLDSNYGPLNSALASIKFK